MILVKDETSWDSFGLQCEEAERLFHLWADGKETDFSTMLLPLLNESVQRKKLFSELCNAYVCHGCSSTARSRVGDKGDCARCGEDINLHEASRRLLG